MFISILDLFKIGIGPSSSHTMGPMIAAKGFISRVTAYLASHPTLPKNLSVRCTLRGSLAFTGKGHATDRAILIGLHGYAPIDVAGQDIDRLVKKLSNSNVLSVKGIGEIPFSFKDHIIFDYGSPLPQHPNGMIFELRGADGNIFLSETYFSIGGGFIKTLDEISGLEAPTNLIEVTDCPYPFDSARSMLQMAEDSGKTIAIMKRANERQRMSDLALSDGLDTIWEAMQLCIKQGVNTEGYLPGGLDIARRAKNLHQKFLAKPKEATSNDWLCAYAMAVNEENAAGHLVVTAPTNGAAGVIPAVLYYYMKHQGGSREKMHDFLLTAAAIGGIIKHRSSISGAEVGCQGEVGSAAAMAAAGLCAIRGGTMLQVENAAEIALEHHLGMTCDPVAGLVQVPCIERNGFGAIKAQAAASLALHESGKHFMPLDNCIAAMKQTGLEMSHKFKETSLGGLAVSLTEC